LCKIHLSLLSQLKLRLSDFPLEDLCEGPFFTSKLFTHTHRENGGGGEWHFHTFQGYKIELPLASHRPVWQLQNKIDKNNVCVCGVGGGRVFGGPKRKSQVEIQ